MVTRDLSIRAGAVTFTWASYDPGTDILFLGAGEPVPHEGEDTPEGHVAFFPIGGDRVVGLEVYDASRRLQRDGTITVTFPASSPARLRADQVAPALGSGATA